MKLSVLEILSQLCRVLEQLPKIRDKINFS